MQWRHPLGIQASAAERAHKQKTSSVKRKIINMETVVHTHGRYTSTSTPGNVETAPASVYPERSILLSAVKIMRESHRKRVVTTILASYSKKKQKLLQKKFRLHPTCTIPYLNRIGQQHHHPGLNSHMKGQSSRSDTMPVTHPQRLTSTFLSACQFDAVDQHRPPVAVTGHLIINPHPHCPTAPQYAFNVHQLARYIQALSCFLRKNTQKLNFQKVTFPLIFPLFSDSKPQVMTNSQFCLSLAITRPNCILFLVVHSASSILPRTISYSIIIAFAKSPSNNEKSSVKKTMRVLATLVINHGLTRSLLLMSSLKNPVS